MMRACTIVMVILLCVQARAQQALLLAKADSLSRLAQFEATISFIDIAISSVVAFSSLVKKENYRNRIASLNNPTSSEMGFSLETEVMSALKPLLAKAREVNAGKFQEVVGSLLKSQSGSLLSKSVSSVSPVLPGLISLVGSLTVHEKRITRDDLDSFILCISKYFLQYEKLHNANALFDQSLELLAKRLAELEFELREFVIDMSTVFDPSFERSEVKSLGTEELYLKRLAVRQIQETAPKKYPGDGIKTAKEIAQSLQKLFSEYQKIYSDNYQQIRQVLEESKNLSKTVNLKQLDISLKELQILYNESRSSDMMALRLETLASRLRDLVLLEQLVVGEGVRRG